MRVLFVLLATGTADARAAFIETYTATSTVNITLPGTPSGGGIDFDASLTLNSIDFAPGAVVFQGQPVDFDGKEADFIGPQYTGTVHFPAAAGPAVVTPQFNFSVTGPFNGSWIIDLPGVQLGPLFSPNYLDIAPGGVNMNSIAPSWQSAVVPQLNGAIVLFLGPQNLENVQPTAARFSLSSDGDNEIHAFVIPEPATFALALFGVLSLCFYARLRH
jgi:hypothetical protein